MPAGFTDAARELGLKEQVNRTFWIELHTADPGNPNAATPLARGSVTGRIAPGTNGYYGKFVAAGGFIVEGSSDTEARYANSADVDFGAADSSDNAAGWGTIGWISIWYDADDAAATDPVQADSTKFDTCFCVMQLQTDQSVGTGDPFVIRASTIDLISRNAA